MFVLTEKGVTILKTAQHNVRFVYKRSMPQIERGYTQTDTEQDERIRLLAEAVDHLISIILGIDSEIKKELKATENFEKELDNLAEILFNSNKNKGGKQ